jgi:hypothetical protein
VQVLSERLTEETGIYVPNTIELNQFVVRFGSPGPSEATIQTTKAVVSRVQMDGVRFVSGVASKNMWVMRISIISWPTTSADVFRAVDAIVDGSRRERDAAETWWRIDRLVWDLQRTAR